MNFSFSFSKTILYLAVKAGVPEGMYYVGVGQPPGQSYLHGGPIWGTLYVFVLLRRYNLHHNPCRHLHLHSYLHVRAHACVLSQHTCAAFMHCIHATCMQYTQCILHMYRLLYVHMYLCTLTATWWPLQVAR